MSFLVRALLLFAVLCPPLSAAESPILQLTPGGHLAVINDIAFTPDGQYLVSAADDKLIHVWDVETGRIVRTLRGQVGAGSEGKIFAMALSPDGQWLAAGGWTADNEIRLYHFPSGELRALLQGHENVVNALAFDADGRRLVSGSGDFTARVWDVGRISDSVMRHSDPAADGSAADGGANSRALSALRVLRGHTDAIYAVAFSPDGQRVVTGSLDNTLRLWRADSGELLAEMKGHSDKVYAVAVAPDGTLISGSFDHSIRLWDGRDGKYLRTLADQGSQVGSLSLSADGQYLLSSCGGGGCASKGAGHLWSFPAGKPLHTYSGHDNVVIATALSPDGRWAATGGGNNQEIHIWSTQDGQLKQRLAGDGGTVWAVGFDGDGLVWGNTSHSTQYMNDRGPLEYRLRLPGAERPYLGEPQAIQQIPSLEEMVSVRAAATWQDWSLQHRQGGNYGGDALLDIRRGDKTVATIERGPTDGYDHRSYTFTPDGLTIISGGGNGFLSAYDRDGKPIGNFIGHGGDVWAVAVSADGGLLASGSDDQTVRLWNVRTRENLLTVFHVPPRLPSPSTSSGNGKRGSPAPLPEPVEGSGAGEWVAWTPQGYYAASPGGDKLIGWQINRGAERAADFVGAAQLRRHFYRPDIVAQAVLLGSAERAVAAAGNTDFVLDDLLKASPPQFEIEQQGIVIKDNIARIPVRIAPGSELKDLELYVNGRKITGRGITVDVPNQRQGFIRYVEVPMVGGKNELELRGSNAFGETAKDIVIQNSGGGGKPGKLYLLAIGVESYPQLPGVAKLQYAGDDAFALREALLRHHGGVYSKVETQYKPE